MKQRRKIAILLVVTLALQMMPLPAGSLAGVLGIFSVSQAADDVAGGTTKEDGIEWSVSADGKTLTLTGQGSNEMDDYGSKTYDENTKNEYVSTNAPWGKYAKTITTVTITGVQSLGTYAFYKLGNLSSITGLGNVTNIGASAFMYCSSLQSADLSKAESIGDWAFYSCSKLATVTRTDTATTIGDSAFSKDEYFTASNQLTTISLAGVTKVGNSAFARCANLTTVLDSESVTSFGNSAFKDSGLTTISLKEDATMGTSVFAGSDLMEVTWPSKNNTISAKAFQNCTKIKTIRIPDNVTKIQDNAFNFCSNATTIENLDRQENPVTEIGSGVFSSCNKLTATAWSHEVPTISEKAFANCGDGGTDLEITIPDYVTAIGASAFSASNTQGSVTIPDNVTTVGSNAFNNCSKLKSVTIGAGVETIEDSAFYNCNNLSSLTWNGTALETIGDDAFSRTALTKFVVPASVTSIGVNPFVGGQLNTIEVEDGNTKYAVENKMLVTKGSPKQVISYPCNAGTDAVVPDTVKEINKNAFYEARVYTVKLPEGLQSMGSSAFAASSLKTVKLPGSLSAVSKSAFSNTSSLKSIEFQNGLTTIGENAFYESALESVKFPGSLLTIQSSAFEHSSLTAVDGRGGMLKSVGGSVFKNCANLTDVHFGGDLESLGSEAFYGCKKISEITLPDSLRTVGESAFSNCIKLRKIVFPNSVETVMASVLSGCASLESADFGSEVKSIAGDVFLGCPKLSELTMSENNPYMMTDENVLYDKEQKKIIYYAAGLPEDKFSVPKGVETVCSKAFTCCGHLEELRFPDTVKKVESYAVSYNTSINKIFFYGDAPATTTDYSWPQTSYGADGKKILTYTYYNTAITNNTVGSNGDKALIVFVLKDSTGWNKGWSDVPYEDNDTVIPRVHYAWKETYHFDNTRWDPTKTDVSSGKFSTGLEWVYRDDVGELEFIGTGAVPDYDENENLFTWVDKNAEEWLDSLGEKKDYMPDVKSVLTGGATRIGKNAFKGAGRLYRVVTTESLREIGEGAFAGCPSLAVVDVSKCDKIEKEAFKDDTAIKDDMDARGVKEIGDGAFSGCNGMTEILLGEGLQSLGNEAFASCSALETMMLPESTQALGEGTFTGCSSLRTINIPAAIQDIQAACFKDCAGLQKVYFYGDCPLTRAEDAFAGCHADLVLYCRAAYSSWDGVNDWNGVPVVHLDKFYTEREDHYSFANTGSSFGYSSVYYIPLQRYVTAMQSIIRGSFYHAWDSEWGGSCFGMASSSTEFYQGSRFNVADYTAGAEHLYDVAAPRNDRADLTKLIEIYQVSQFVDDISWEIEKNRYQYRKLIKQVEEFERSGGLLTDETADPLVMCLYANYAAHAVVPVAVNMDSEGNYILDVYDSNYPDSFQKIKIRKDFKGIEYGSYKQASFVRYSTIRDALVNADFTGFHVRKQEKESNTVAIAVNRENVSLVNKGNRDYKEIEGAYEQNPAADGEEDTFSGIRSFILPQDEVEYNMKTEQTEAEAADDLKYYVATEDLFSEIETSDGDASLNVRSVQGTGYDVVTLQSEKEDTKTELTVMDVSGIEKEISVTGSFVSVEVNDDSKMEVSVSEGAMVTVDGKELELSNDNKAEVSFYAEAGDSPMKVDDLYCELSLDEDNKLSGMAQAYLTWEKKQAGNVDIITKLKDENGRQIAKYTETKRVSLGMQTVNTELEKVTTELGELSGEFNVTCEMTLKDSDGNRVALTPITVTLKAAGEEPAPTATPTAEPTTEPTLAPTASPTAKPNNSSPGGNSGPLIVIPVTPKPTATAVPSPSATKKPSTPQTLVPVETPKPVGPGTPKPVETPEPVITPEPVVTPGIDAESSVPKKGQIKTVGAVKYIVVKSAKKNGTVAVSGVNNKNAAKIVIPKKVKIGGYAFKVTGIRKNAFRNMKKLSQVTVGANVKKIGNNAFKNCKKLQFVIIPSKVTAIGNGAFAGCTKLVRMLVKSNKIKSVGAGAFRGVSSDLIVKTSKKKWKQYSKMFTKKGKMSHNAVFVVDPVKLKFGNKSY